MIDRNQVVGQMKRKGHRSWEPVNAEVETDAYLTQRKANKRHLSSESNFPRERESHSWRISRRELCPLLVCVTSLTLGVPTPKMG